MSVEISGFEDFADELDEFEDRGETIDGKNSVSFAELFPPDIMHTYSGFNSIHKFFEESP